MPEQFEHNKEEILKMAEKKSNSGGIIEKLTDEEIEERKKYFFSIGFLGDWVEKLENKKPSLYNQNNVDNKIQGLQQRGFSNPHKMIESLPPILGYAFENIDRKIKILDKLIKLYSVNLSPVELIEKNKSLLGTKFEKLIVLARVIKKYSADPKDASNVLVNKLLFSNIEDVLVAMAESDNDDDINIFMKKVKEIKERKILKDEKREIIEKQIPDSDKIKREYFKGYPKK